MKTWTFFDNSTGIFTGRTFSGDDRDLPANKPEGQGAVAGAYDHLSQRVDLETGEVVDYQPPAPPDTALLRHEWEPTIRRWVEHKTPAAHEADRRARIVSQIGRVELGQQRALRELTLNPNSADARSALEVMDAQITSLRAELHSAPK